MRVYLTGLAVIGVLLAGDGGVAARAEPPKGTPGSGDVVRDLPPIDPGKGGGALAPFGVPGGGGGIGPAVWFVGIRGNAMRVALVVDASVAAGKEWDAIRKQVQMTADALRPVQQFAIVTAADGAVRVLGTADGEKPRLAQGVPEKKRAAYEALDSAKPGSKPALADGLRTAAGLGPQLIFVYCADPAGAAGLADAVRAINADRPNKVRVHVAYGGPRDEAAERALKDAATAGAGEYKAVDVRRAE